MAFKTVTISSDYKLEEQIAEFLKKTGMFRSEFHRRSSAMFMRTINAPDAIDDQAQAIGEGKLKCQDK